MAYREGRAVTLSVGVGGALGTLARYGIIRWLPTPHDGFPWSTFLVNVSGSLIVGVVMTLVAERWPPTTYARPFLAVGFCGGYTTLSAVAMDTVLLARDGRVTMSVAYPLLSVALGMVAVFAGVMAVRALNRRQGGEGR